MALDINLMDPIEGVTFIQGSIEDKEIQDLIFEKNNRNKFDLLISDMSPNKTGNKVSDQFKFYNIADSILEFFQIDLYLKGRL